jgi:energy-converting hydrogenase B subunit D
MSLQVALYALVIFGAAITVFTPDPRKAIFAFSFYGLTLGILFLVLQAPDVSLSEIVVGSAAVPLVVLVTLSRMREPR